MDKRVVAVADEVRRHLAEISKLFVPGSVKLTFLARAPDLADGNILITEEDEADYEAIVAAVRRFAEPTTDAPEA